ncbi:MAG: hypothetical protein ACTSVI_09860 [Promethearchaeota archaeon]
MNGIIVGKWNDVIGIEIVAEYPLNFRKKNGIDTGNLLNIFNERIVQDKPGVEISQENSHKIISYYGPIIPDLYEEANEQELHHGIIFLFTDKNINLDNIKEQFIEFSIATLELINENNFSELFFNIIDNFAFLEPLSEEQRYAAIYNSEIREEILKKLGEGPISKANLMKWIEKTFNLPAFDFNGIIMPFLKTDLVKQVIETTRYKIKEIYYYLLKDVYLFRIPPKKILDLIHKGNLKFLGEKAVQYLENVKNFFEDYELTPSDINKISRLLSIPNMYKIIMLLRDSVFELDELRIYYLEKFNYLPSNFNYLLSLLERADIVKSYKINKKNYYLLQCDIQFQVFFPEYLVDNIRKAWRENKIEKNVAVRHLTLLRDEYLEKFINFPKSTKKSINSTISSTKEKSIIQDINVKEKIAKKIFKLFGQISA